MNFTQVRDKVEKVCDCKPRQKVVAFKYCNRLISKYLKGSDEIAMLSVMLVHMKYAMKDAVAEQNYLRQIRI